ncbi:MAG TPA: SRPBCC family protein [Kofleriaceae bacterium]
MQDRIIKSITLRAPRERVWTAISESKQLGAWFGAEFDGPFVAGKPITGRIVPTQVDPDVAKLQEPHRGAPMTWEIVTIEPMTSIAFRWHPFAIDKTVDYEKEPSTLVEFRLEDAPGGTKLTITESGFDQLPPERRAKAYEANVGGWDHQTKLVERYLAQSV